MDLVQVRPVPESRRAARVLVGAVPEDLRGHCVGGGGEEGGGQVGGGREEEQEEELRHKGVHDVFTRCSIS